MIEGSGSGSRAGSGSRSIPLTNGYRPGSRRLKNIWIRIRNTARYKVKVICNVIYYLCSIHLQDVIPACESASASGALLRSFQRKSRRRRRKCCER
jgi:hypothetical protein